RAEDPLAHGDGTHVGVHADRPAVLSRTRDQRPQPRLPPSAALLVVGAHAPPHRVRDDGRGLGNPQKNRLLQRLIPMPMLLILAAICLSLSALCVGNLATLPARNRRARIRTAATYGNVRVSSRQERARFQERVFSQIGRASW